MEVDCVPETDEEKPVGVGKQLGFPCSPFRSGSRFKGFQQSKGNKYQVEVIIQVHAYIRKIISLVQYIDHKNDLLSGYLKIQGLTEVNDYE